MSPQEDFEHRPILKRVEVITHRDLPIRIDVEESFLDRCWRLQNLWAYRDKQVGGYLRMMTIDPEAFERLYPSPIDYMRKRMGYSGTYTREDLSRGARPSGAVRQARERMNQDRALFNRWWISFVQVGGNIDHPATERQNLRGQGVGTALYGTAAMYQANHGRKLWGLDHPSPSARALWDKLLQQPFGEMFQAREEKIDWPGQPEGRVARTLQGPPLAQQNGPLRLDQARQARKIRSR